MNDERIYIYLYLHFNNIEITLSMNSLLCNNFVALTVVFKEHGIASRLSTKHILRSLFGELLYGPPPLCSEATVLSLYENNDTKN